MRKTLAAGAALAAGVALLVPATADAATTNLTLTITAGALNISAPAEVAADGSLPAVYTWTVPDVTVTDDRGNLVAAWTAKAALGDFVGSGAAVGADAVAATNATYVAGPIVALPGGGYNTVVGVPVASLSMTNAAQTVMTGTGVGKNQGKWSPVVTVPQTAFSVSGNWTAVLTHSVA